MAYVISFVNRKGGTGKTTNAIHLATFLTHQNNKVLVVETDTNHVIASLRQADTTSHVNIDNAFDILESEQIRVIRDIKENIRREVYDYIIVDNAGNTDDYTTYRLCEVSDLVIIPTGITLNDLLVLRQTLQDLHVAGDDDIPFQMVILPNRIHSRTNIETVEKTLKPFGIPVLPAYIPAKKRFTLPSTVIANEEFNHMGKLIMDVINSVPAELH